MKISMNQNSKKYVLAISVSLLFSGCSTFMKKSTRGHSLNASSLPKTSVVQLQQNKSAIKSDLPRNQWLEIRKASNSLERKMYATLALGEYRVSIVEAKAHLVKYPKSYGALDVLSMSHAGLGDFSRSLYYSKLIGKFHGNHPQHLNLKALAVLAKTKKQRRHYQLALELLRESFDQNEADIASGLNLGHLYLDIGDSKRAEEVFGETSVRCGGCVEAVAGHGVSATRTKNYELAKKSFLKVLAKRPSHESTLYRMALVEKNGYNNPKRASEYLEKLLDNKNRGDERLRRRAYVMLRKIKGQDSSIRTASDVHDFDSSSGAETLLDEVADMPE